MANDIIDINVYETVETVAITVNPNLTTVNINRQVPVGVNAQDLQSVTDIGATTTNGINIDTEDTYEIGLYAISSAVGIKGESRETYGVQGYSNSATGVYGTSDSGYGVQGYSASGVAIYGDSIEQIGVKANSYSGTAMYVTSDIGTGLFVSSESGVGVSAYSNSIGLEVNGNGTIAIQANLGNSNKGLVINSGTSSTGNFIELDKNGVDKLVVNQQGELTATKLIKQGGTSSQFLMADGSVSTGGGGGGSTNLSPSQTATNFTINSDTGTDATIPLGNGTLAGATLNDYTTAEKTKLDGIAVGAEVNVNANWNATSGDAQILNKPTISGSNTGDQDLQSVTNIGASTSNPISVGVTGFSTGINSASQTGIGVNGISDSGIGIEGYAGTGIGVNGYSETGVAAQFETDSVSANIANFKQSGSIVASVTNNGNINANAFVKSGGTSSQILAADGSVITAGTNITITGGQISSIGGTGGGGSSVNYYLNGGTSQGAFGGTTYYEFSKTAVIGTGADFSRGTNGYIASFITDVADPSLLLIPAGNWNLEFFFSASSNGGTPSFYVELYKYDGTTFTLITSSSATPEGITNGTSIDAYFTALAVPETILTVNDRLAIRVFVNASSKTITLHTQNGHLCEVITTFTAGLTALNGLQAQVQNFATGTTGTDFAINSSGSTHTFNLPSASATARGVVTTGTQTFAGDKTFTGAISASNLSNTNTGDNATNTQYSGLATSKQDTLQSTVNIKSINGNSILGSGDLTITASAASQGAYTMLANNTASSAVATEKPFENINNDVYSGTIVWTGGAAPTVPNHTYSLSQVGNLVTLTINLAYGTAGASTLTNVSMELPSTAPQPSAPSSVTAAGDVLSFISGNITTSKATPTTNGLCVLRLKSTSPNVFEASISRASGSHRYAYATIQYFV